METTAINQRAPNMREIDEFKISSNMHKVNRIAANFDQWLAMKTEERPHQEISEAAYTYLQRFPLKQKRLYEGYYNTHNSG